MDVADERRIFRGAGGEAGERAMPARVRAGLVAQLVLQKRLADEALRSYAKARAEREEELAEAA